MIAYHKSNATIGDNLVGALCGFAVGFLVVFVFYNILSLSLIFGAIAGVINIFLHQQTLIKKRKNMLRTQFLELLEAMGVAMRAGNPPVRALESARGDLTILYGEDGDIIKEANQILARFQNSIPLSASFSDLADRSGLEDIQSFASIYATIEGKSNRADEIIKEIQQIISEKMLVEMEMDTLISGIKGQFYIMVAMPLFILVVMRYAGGGFLDAIYTTSLGRVAATVALVIYVAAYFMGRKFATIDV